MRALILVDLQNDFVPGGALPVPHGDDVIPVANRVQKRFDLIVATQDWHPLDHGSFAIHHKDGKPGDVIDLNGLTQVLWPVHCVQDTPGAAFVPELDMERVKKVFRKGDDKDIDSYSGFFDNDHRRSTGLGEYLKERSVTDVYVLGLATDYCVRFTALDAQSLGFQTYLIEDACRGVDLTPGDVAAAIREMTAAGGRVLQSSEVGGK